MLEMNEQKTAPATNAKSAIEFDRVTFRHVGVPSSGQTGEIRILDNFSLAIERGETLALVGRSGMGKTTILKLINRLLLPQTGAVRVEARATTDWDAIR